jgi:hypothetical protein
LSCFGKLFTAVLLTRLNAFSENFSILNENQSGFRKGYSTIDNIFAKKEKVIVTFVDFEKAFGKVWRDGLWCILLLNNINGISSFDSDIITVSSAYKSTIFFKYTSSSPSKSSVIDVKPLTFLSDGLWCILLLNNINGKMYKVIYNMYQNIKSRIVYNNAVSDFFDCNNGVRQGENLSLSFSRYI